jgi:uncharacterized membrane protein YgcG
MKTQRMNVIEGQALIARLQVMSAVDKGILNNSMLNSAINLKKPLIFSLFFIGLTIAIPLLAGAAVTTDKDDYSPGETVTISGDGYLSGETVYISVTAPYGIEAGFAVSNIFGEFEWSFDLPNDDSALGNYSYSSQGLTSGVIQSGTFTDGNVKVFPSPSSQTFTLTKTTFNTTNCTGAPASGPTIVNNVSSPSGHTVASISGTQSVRLQAAATSNQGGAFANWSSASPFTGTNPICVTGFPTGTRDYFANYGTPPAPTLTVTKIVINDDGGTAVVGDFPLFIDGFPVTSGVASTTSAGAHTVSETTLAGYSASVWGGDCNPDGTISLTPGQNANCTITNDDVAVTPPPASTCPPIFTFSASVRIITCNSGSITNFASSISNSGSNSATGSIGGNGGKGGDVRATGSENNGNASAGSGGSGGNAQRGAFIRTGLSESNSGSTNIVNSVRSFIGR